MFQRFYTDTLGSRFIKSLLAQTPIPVFEAVSDGDQLLEGCYYVYRDVIIKCHTTGILGVSKTVTLVPSQELYPSEFLFVGSGLRGATFYVVARADAYNVKTHSTFNSTTNYYDSETHYHLGRYLRYLYTTTGLNLFPFYNSFNSTYFSDVKLSVTSDIYKPVAIDKVVSNNQKVVGVPIRFGKTYTIHIDCPSNVALRACIHDDSGFLSEDNYSEEIQTLLSNSGKVYSRLVFNEPITFRIETSSKAAFMLQHNLYLVIQLPEDNNSSIVVFENTDFSAKIQTDKNQIRQYTVINPSLSYMNTNVTYAFSPRLLEYLVGQVIHKHEFFPENIELVQNNIAKFKEDYKRSLISGKIKRGIWDKNIPQHIFEIVDNYSQSNLIFDQDGNFNKDVQKIIYSKGGKY